ncbi:hypothetical protein pkur_cds_252 [Pandoravirus kuranda]|uniref:Uncharacterized protein n=1 Tax=Pandoravirus kuranda TaxID=3019033 RepID=A0AA95J3H7_9VIRU|nr:hypothetical protein pkur_cds_252 [Pandoravirus kuranda]
MIEASTDTAGGDVGLSSVDPGPEARALFSSVVAHHADFDAEIAWPTDPEAMMRAHYPSQTWPMTGPGRAAPTGGARVPSVCSIVGGTDAARATAVKHVAEFMASFSGKPYAAITSLVHPMDRQTVIGRALLDHAPPTCIHDDVATWCGRTHPPPGCVGQRLFLVYMSLHITWGVFRAVVNARHLRCHFIIVLGEGVQLQPRLRNQFDAVAMLPPLGVPLDEFVHDRAEQSMIQSLLDRGRSVVFYAHGQTVLPFNLPTDTDDHRTPIQDQFHAHVAWRMHYALTRAGSPHMRRAQATLRTQDAVPALARSCARACLAQLDVILDANVPAECLHHIALEAALWIDPADDSPSAYAAVAALRRFMGHLARLCIVPDMAPWPTVAMIRHLLSSVARLGPIWEIIALQ